MFDTLKYAKPSKTPRVLGIDEFKGNAGGEKYLAILTDVENKKVIDILPNRNYDYLLKYFNKINRANTEFFVSDMWKPYRNLKSVHFEKSKLITDKYHFVRQVIWDFEKVRKEEQKRFSKKYRLTFKRSKILLTKRFYSLNRDEVQKVKNIFRISPRLQEAHDLKEDFLNILKEKDFSFQCEQLKNWIYTARAYEIPEFKSSITAISNWFDSIKNALEHGFPTVSPKVATIKLRF